MPLFWFEIIGCALALVVCVVPALRTNSLLVVAVAVLCFGLAWLNLKPAPKADDAR